MPRPKGLGPICMLEVPYRGSYSTNFRIWDKSLVHLARLIPEHPNFESPTLFPRCPKNVIPKRGADAISNVIIFVMMAEMILFQPKPHPPFHLEVMDRVMDRVVANVAKSKPSGEGRREPAKANGKERPK